MDEKRKELKQVQLQVIDARTGKPSLRPDFLSRATEDELLRITLFRMMAIDDEREFLEELSFVVKDFSDFIQISPGEQAHLHATWKQRHGS
jgi:hypothetical protein